VALHGDGGWHPTDRHLLQPLCPSWQQPADHVPICCGGEVNLRNDRWLHTSSLISSLLSLGAPFCSQSHGQSPGQSPGQPTELHRLPAYRSWRCWTCSRTPSRMASVWRQHQKQPQQSQQPQPGQGAQPGQAALSQQHQVQRRRQPPMLWPMLSLLHQHCLRNRNLPARQLHLRRRQQS
jgi:hypothetical protein